MVATAGTTITPDSPLLVQRTDQIVTAVTVYESFGNDGLVYR